jgi:hypothetical protein
MTYLNEFITAENLTNKFGNLLDSKAGPRRPSKEYLITWYSTFNVLLEESQHLVTDPERWAAYNCINVHHSMMEKFSLESKKSHADSRFDLTVGYISGGVNFGTAFGEQEITLWKKQKPFSVNGKTVPFHVWITLNKCWVIDFTIAGYCKLAAQKPIIHELNYGKPDANCFGSMKLYPSNNKLKIQYHPVAIGFDLIRTIA